MFFFFFFNSALYQGFGTFYGSNIVSQIKLKVLFWPIVSSMQAPPPKTTEERTCTKVNTATPSSYTPRNNSSLEKNPIAWLEIESVTSWSIGSDVTNEPRGQRIEAHKLLRLFSVNNVYRSSIWALWSSTEVVLKKRIFCTKTTIPVLNGWYNGVSTLKLIINFT